MANVRSFEIEVKMKMLVSGRGFSRKEHLLYKNEDQSLAPGKKLGIATNSSAAGHGVRGRRIPGTWFSETAHLE